jgi:glycosyltransferase involved in cell wall biosynthesis
MITLVIPTYRNPECLNICLRSATENRIFKENKILVVVDGFYDESKHILEKYKKDILILDLEENHGMQHAQNVGVMQADTKYIFIINDDNVLPSEWDSRLSKELAIAEITFGEKFVLTVNQIEPPTDGHSMFYFPELNLGESPQTFDYSTWLEIEPTYSVPTFENTGNIYPFVIQKKWYLACGGFDTFYDSPNLCDWDYFFKLQLLEFKSPRTYNMHLYHFGSVSTKKNQESERFKERERLAMETYMWKWGVRPYNEDKTNSKIPPGGVFRGFKI